MAYYYLTREVKKRLIRELKDLFQFYPTLEKMRVTDKFPLDERPQFGVVFKNISGTPLPLSSDNFMGTQESHVLQAKLKGKKGLFLDWVREDTKNITEFVEDEDLSSQVAPGNHQFFTSDPIVEGLDNLTFATTTRQVRVKVDGVEVDVSKVVGITKEILLPIPPVVASKVEVTYFKRNLVASGLYYIDLINENQVMVDSLLDFNEVIIPSATGAETTFSLPNAPLFPNTFDLIEGENFVLEKGVHYTLDETTGLLTFLPQANDPSFTLRPRQSYRVNFRHQGDSFGPFDVCKSRAENKILPGVTLAFSNWFEVGDRIVVVITDQREPSFQEYGGKWDISATFDIYSRDPIQREFIADLVAIQFYGIVKPKFDGIGLHITNVSLNGETEDLYDETTDTVYFMAGIDISIQADWRLLIPLVPKVKFLVPDIDIIQSISAFQADFVPTREGFT